MSTKDTPTARPWRTEPSAGRSSARVLIDGNGYLFAEFDDAGNAEHAVRCVNAYDDLLAALEELLRVNYDLPEKDPTWKSACYEAWQSAKAAVAKAKPPEPEPPTAQFIDLMKALKKAIR